MLKICECNLSRLQIYLTISPRVSYLQLHFFCNLNLCSSDIIENVVISFLLTRHDQCFLVPFMNLTEDLRTAKFPWHFGRLRASPVSYFNTLLLYQKKQDRTELMLKFLKSQCVVNASMNSQAYIG